MSGMSLPIGKEPGKNSPRSTASSSDPHQELTTVEIDLVDDHITILNVNTEPMPPERLRFEQNSAAAKRLTSFSSELRRFASVPEPRSLPRRSNRTGEAIYSSATHALKGLKFTSTTDRRESRKAIEKRFDAITETTDGLLHRSQFGKCIGMDSEGFALELVDALARRSLMNGEAINKEQLVEFWEQISDSNFDSRLHTFFDIVDKDGDGRISEDEVKEIIILSASANKLSNIQKRADEFAALMMEDLDPDNSGYITIESLGTLLLQASTETTRTPEDTPMLNYKINPTQPSYSTWKKVASPVNLCTGQRLMRAFRFAKTVTITKIALYPGEVLALHMLKPPGFRYKSGQYMFIKCAEESPFQWHPFFFTSAPQDDYLSVHIKALGDWTEALRERFVNACQPPSVDFDGLSHRNMLYSANNPKLPTIQIDAPYGATPQEYKKYKVVLLVGMGIGVTPMISVLRDIVNNIKAREEEAETETTEKGSSERLNFVTKKAYFYWLTEEQGTFEWFKNTINEVAELEHNHVIELHNYCTSVFEKYDARSAVIAGLQSLNYAKNGVDVVSGTKVMSHFAEPDWRSVYGRIAINHPNTTVGVFHCGSPAETKTLRHLARKFTDKTSTRFAFHKENF